MSGSGEASEVAAATKDLVKQLHDEMELQVKKVTVDDVLQCGATPAYREFAFLTREEACGSRDCGVARLRMWRTG